MLSLPLQFRGVTMMVPDRESAYTGFQPAPLTRTLAAPLALPLQTAKGRTFESHARSLNFNADAASAGKVCILNVHGSHRAHAL